MPSPSPVADPTAILTKIVSAHLAVTTIIAGVVGFFIVLKIVKWVETPVKSKSSGGNSGKLKLHGYAGNRRSGYYSGRRHYRRSN